MSAPERIPVLLEKLHALWQTQPNVQFGQLIFDLYLKVPETRRTKDGTINFFDVGDDALERVLDQELEAKRDR